MRIPAGFILAVAVVFLLLGYGTVALILAIVAAIVFLAV